MKQKIIAIVLAIVIVAAGIAAAYVLTGDNGDKEKKPAPAATVTDSVGREVEVPDNLDGGIVTVGWGILKFLAFFDARDKVVSIDATEKTPGMGTLQPHYYCYDMSKISTHTDSMYGGFPETDAEAIAASHPSLVIMGADTYKAYQTTSDTLASACCLVVVDLTSMMTGYWEIKDGAPVLVPSLQNTLHILGDVLGEGDRDEQVIDILSGALADISAHRMTASPKMNLAGSQMGMGSGDLNVVFPSFSVFDLCGADNAAKGYTAPFFTVTLPVDEYTSSYGFDVMVYDPSMPSLLANPDDQAVLEWMYGLQGTPDEKKVYVILTTALVGFDMLNVFSDAYFLEAAIGGTITQEYVKTQMTQIYKDLFGETVGGAMWDDLCGTMEAYGAASGVHTALWEQVKVGKVDGAFTFVAA